MKQSFTQKLIGIAYSAYKGAFLSSKAPKNVKPGVNSKNQPYHVYRALPSFHETGSKYKPHQGFKEMARRRRQMNYIVCWRSKITGNKGYGKRVSYKLAIAWVKYGNATFRDIEHFMAPSI